MNEQLKTDAWKIIETQFCKTRVESSESLFSLGNGVMGQRANFEEKYTGESLPGNYIGGIYYPDKTRVGWWKNGYPEYFAKVVNSAFWIGVDLKIEGEEIDLAKNEIISYHRELDMQHSLLSRQVKIKLKCGKEIEINAVRFISLTNIELGVIKYTIKSLQGDIEVEISPYINADVRNADANYDKNFWEYVNSSRDSIQMRTKKSGFDVAWSQACFIDGVEWRDESEKETIRETSQFSLKQQEEKSLYKYVGICSSLNHPAETLIHQAMKVAKEAAQLGFHELLKQHSKAWEQKWYSCDIEIEGDDQSQQGIRYCIFMLLQTYTGIDTRLNIGPKGFTGEKYGGVTYWDTEAYCLQFYLSTSGQQVAKELLVYRYNQLDKAIENAENLGFKEGAALYPMVTINGEECHNEWEITFEEIHRNGAIAYAIYNYIRYTGDKAYLSPYGLDVLIGIARFWAQRVSFSQERHKYVILGVTGPNEYENNVNNNWYTNYIASWCLKYAAESVEFVKNSQPNEFQKLIIKRNFNPTQELEKWKAIYENIYLPYNEKLAIFMQQDAYMDKEQILVADLAVSERPINQKWSWDRILRSCFIKQADVLQGIYFFQEDFDTETIARNFHFYEPRTVHESSLSPSIHTILATKIGDMDKAYEMYLRSSRLDLDDYNREIDEGLHITSMAGSWLALTEGFGGMRIKNDIIGFTPTLPKAWSHILFKINYRDRIIKIKATHKEVVVSIEGEAVDISIYGKTYHVTDHITHLL